LFAAKNWGSASLAFTSFGAAFILARIFFSHMLDRNGAKVALVCVLIEVVGLLLIWQAGSPVIAYAGTALAGFGYSLAFPGFGVEAVRRAPPQARGAAMGAFVAFLDIALGLTGPAAGAIASVAGVSAAYLAGACAVTLSAFVAVYLIVKKPA
jgi:predicted MFS family arabinose efflux permease